nr:putative rad60/SUMO-like domain, ubiquitin-related domain protein [Tanacetum cinerariifolium]
MAAEPIEELEPLFDYTRVQPINYISLDDDDDDDDVRCLVPSKRTKSTVSSTGEKVQLDAQVVDIDNGKDDDDDLTWLDPPPKLVVNKQKPLESSTIKELRQKQQELLSITESAKAIAQEENVKRDLMSSMDTASESPVEKLSKPAAERSKIVISIQDKDGQKQFRVYTDDMFERLFKMYADKAKLKVENLVFCFDGDKVDPTATPSSLEMEDGDMIEVNVKSS